MTEWVVDKSNPDMWLVREEQLAPDRWMVCFKPTDQNKEGDYWLNVMDKQWSKSSWGEWEAIEECSVADPLMQVCIMHEWRKKYGAEQDGIMRSTGDM